MISNTIRGTNVENTSLFTVNKHSEIFKIVFCCGTLVKIELILKIDKYSAFHDIYVKNDC